MKHDCENLDAFLADELREGDASRFAAHMAKCDGCREAVDQQRWVDSLLSSPLHQELESPPSALLGATRATILSRRRRTRLAAGGLAAAAVLLAAAGWSALWQWSFERESELHAVALGKGDEPSPNPSVTVRGTKLSAATFVGGPDLLVVPVEFSHANVTVVRVYQTYQPNYAAQASVYSPVWPNDFNGDYP